MRSVVQVFNSNKTEMVGFLPGYIMTKTWKRYWPPVMESRDETSLETHFCESRY